MGKLKKYKKARERELAVIEEEVAKAPPPENSPPPESSSIKSKRGMKRAKDDEDSTSSESAPDKEEEDVVAVGDDGAVKTAAGKRRKSLPTNKPMSTAAAAAAAAAARTLPLLICSIGNPGKTYANTLHSAGHTVLNKLAAKLGYGEFGKERELGNGLVSYPPSISGGSSLAGGSGPGDWTLWQSTSYMNDSGEGVRAAFTSWSKKLPVGEEGRLVVLYDELEKGLGFVTVKTSATASAKGHNGLKSIIASLSANKTPFARVGVGIGRPASRESNDVARYVLRKMTNQEREKIEGCVEEVVKKLKELEKVQVTKGPKG
jgi:peptidyl-tRNA hydrolase, PTH1 family